MSETWKERPCTCPRLTEVSAKAVFTRATFGLFVARHRDWRRQPTVTRHPNRCRGGCRRKWNMSQCLLRSDTFIYDAATQCPVDELVLTLHLVYRHSSVCQFPARLYLGHSRTPDHWSQRSLIERRSCKHIVNLSGVNGSQADGRHLGPQIARVNTALVGEHDFASEN